MLSSFRRALLILAVIFPIGCIHFPQTSISKYQAGGSVPSLKTVSKPGDYALYYTSDSEPQIPIHLNAGDSIGFVKIPDGRVQAVAGSFRMNISTKETAAYWKRMPPTEH